MNEIKKTSLASIICENADDIKHIQSDVFLNAEWPLQMKSCSEILRESKMSFDAWKDCCKHNNNDICLNQF